MRAFAVVTFLISTLSAQFAAAQIKSFPYDAKVVVDEVFVRSARETRTIRRRNFRVRRSSPCIGTIPVAGI